MTDRDKLIELIKASVYGNIDEGFDGPVLNCENVADYLLANGVIVPPCNAGDTIYKINKIPNSACAPFITKEKVEPYAVFYKNIMGSYSCIPFEAFNKTAFLSEEKAEEKLEEMKHG